ncbi:MAG: ThuA domain-containing protein [Chthoniobacteraceae bacterium]
MKNILRTLLVTAAGALLVLPAYAADSKKVIVVTVTTGFRHSSIPTAEKVLQQLADESKAFTIVDFVRQPEVDTPKKPNAPRKPNLKEGASEDEKAKYERDMERYTRDEARYQEAMSKWTAADDEKVKSAEAQFQEKMKQEMAKLSVENLEKVDGVIFANTTGDLPLPDKEGFIKWIEAGHALMAMHSGSDTFHNFPAYVSALGGEFASHGAQVGVDLVKKDPNHPATAGLPDPWGIKQEEIYLFKSYDQKRVRDLWSLDKHPNEKTAGHYPVSWVRKAGEGKVFYTSLGHREDIWDADPEMKGRVNPPETAKQFQQHILGGIKWALGLAEGSSESVAK